MDAKDLRAETALTERSNDGVAKFTLQYDRSKSHDVGTSAFKGDTTSVRPCAVIGPDRVVPPARDGTKKAPVEPWLTPDTIYRRLPDYPYKMPDHKDPTRNISPRQTFQENMQRIIMPPGYNAMKLHEDPSFASKNTKLNVPSEVKYCEVPYNINQVSSDQKHIRNADHSVSNVNPLLMRGVPHGWPAGSVHVRPLRTFGAPEVLPYPDYANCAGPRPVLTRTHAPTHEEPLYPEPYYHENNIRYKPYPNIKERYPQSRYEYLGNYPNPYHPPNPFAHKYELPKTMPSHSYPGYPQVPKYSDRIPEPLMDGYQRALTQQTNYGVPIRNPVIHPPYRPVPGNQMPNKLNAYPPDLQQKPVPNNLPYDQASKMYLDYDNRSKPLPMPDNYYLNDLPRPYHAKNSIVVPNFTSSSMHGVNAHPYYIKENMSYPRYKNMDPSVISHSITKLPPQFSPSTLAISPAESNASNETAQTYATSQEDCGYVSQSSATSVRSIDSLNRIPMDPYGRYDYRYGPIVRASPSNKTDHNSNQGAKSKKDIRQFISSWSEGDDENAENSSKRDSIKNIPDEKHTLSKQYDAINTQGQLYVLGLVNVPSEDLSKYDHIQKVSKLPENIKGYNSLELLNQFEEAIESSNIISVKPPTPRTVQMPLKSMTHKHDPIPRPLSPLDVEAKISQSVIHKEVGCNFEIKPCSPKMLNVEVATPMQMLNERVIEKVTNPHNIKSPIILQAVEENLDHAINKSMKCPLPNTASSCKMINSQHQSSPPTIDNLKTSYTLQDLESNSGVCLASLPRLDTDIELNFPEVNQQFINANKTDSVITSSFTKDLPTLDVERSTIASTECDMNYQFSPKIENETDFSRLSKYRKLKRCVPDENDTALANVQATRVDSVIIKNPDNTKGLEESDNTESNFRDDLQEFAMNLVSQTKYLNHQDNLDKILETSTNSAIVDRYDDSKPDSPTQQSNKQANMTEETSSNAIHPQTNIHNKDLSKQCFEKASLDIKMLDTSTNSAIVDRYDDSRSDLPNSVTQQSNKQANVTEETSSNAIHPQTNIHNKDLSKQCFEKASLDIPMNLSPQARYPTTDVDEENRNGKTGNKTAILEETFQFAAVNTDTNKKIHNEEKYISSISLDKPCDLKNVQKDVSDIQCRNTQDWSPSAPNTPVSNFTTVLSKEHEMKNQEKDNLVLFTENQTTQTKAVPCTEQEKTMFETEIIDDLSDNVTVTKTTSNRDRVKYTMDNKNKWDKSNMCTDKVNYKHTTVQYNQNQDNITYVPKLKRRKFRGEGTHRKRSSENKPVNIVSHNMKEKDEKPNKIAPQPYKEDLVGQQTLKQAEIAEESIITQINFISKDGTEVAQLPTTAFLNEMQKTKNLQLEPLNDPNKGIQENSQNMLEDKEIAQIFPNDIETNISLPCSPNKDKCLETIYESEIKEELQKKIPSTIDTEKCNESANQISGDQIVSSEVLNNNVLGVQANTNVNYDAKERNILLKYHQDEETEAQSNNINLETKDENMLAPDIQGKKPNETKKYPIINSDINAINTPDFTDQRKEPRADPNIENFNTSIQNNRAELKTHENFELISPRNEDRCHVEPCHSDDNLNSVSFKREMQNNLSEATPTNTKNLPVCRGFVNKELFSSRFQNLLFFNENFDFCSNAGKQSTMGNLSVCDPDGEHLNMRLTDAVGVKDLDSTYLIKTIDKTSTTVEYKITNKCVDVSENNNINDGFGKCTKNKDDKETYNLSSELKIKSSSETGMSENTLPKSVENSVSKSHSQEIHTEDEDNLKDFIDECDSNLQFGTKNTALKSADSSFLQSYSSEMEDECVKNTDNSNSESESDLQFANKDMSSKPVYNYGSKSFTKDVGEHFIKSLENYTGKCQTDSQFSIENTVPILVRNCSCDSSLGMVEECDINTENSRSKSKSDLQSPNTDAGPKSVDNPGYKLSPQEIDNDCGKIVENNNGARDFDLQYTNNVESDSCSTNIIVIDESVSVADDCDECLKKPVSSKIQSFIENLNARPSLSLKRSLSDSALNAYDDGIDECSEKKCILPNKRKKPSDISKIEESHLLNIIQSSRRNSVSTLSPENFSFCIFIDDNCIVADENYEPENFMQLENHLLNHPVKESLVVEENVSPVYNIEDKDGNTSDTYINKYDEKVWVEDVGCEETIETEDIAENIVIGDPASPKDTDLTDYESDDEDTDILNNEDADHTSKVKHIYGDNMCTNDAQLVDALYRTPQMDVNRKLMDKESHISEKCNKYYDSDSLEMLLAEPVGIISRAYTNSNINYTDIPTGNESVSGSMNKQSRISKDLEIPSLLLSNIKQILTRNATPNEDIKSINSLTEPSANDYCGEFQEGTMHQFESSLDNVFSYVDKRSNSHKSSSPEVSSTTSEEKNSNLLLKISNFKGSRISEVNCLDSDTQSQNNCKHSTNEYYKSDYGHGTPTKRPLLTKAAQKYIPPLKESIPDLKVKLTLPQQSLLKLQKNKVAKDEPKFSTSNIYSNNSNYKHKKEIPKKIKPKFEDVLKNIDEAQFQMQKAKNKKSKKYIPKVVIKKSENGSHYASTCAKVSVDPDLTGRKWQPWVFIEKNKFIDNMALRHKTRAVFSHRKKTFVLAEKYCKYKSISTAKFVISQPKLNDFTTGNLKYTIKLKQR